MVSQRFQAYGLLLLVFVLGAGAGGGTVYSVMQRRHAAIVHEPHFFEHRRLHSLKRRLHLDREQEHRVAEILAKHREESRTLGTEMVEHCGEQLRAHKAKVESEIRSVLRPEQQARFDELVEERRDHLFYR